MFDRHTRKRPGTVNARVRSQCRVGFASRCVPEGIWQVAFLLLCCKRSRCQCVQLADSKRAKQ